MSEMTKSPASYSWGVAILFVPSFIGLALVLGLLPDARWVQILVVVAIIACVGVGSYLAWWGKRPRAARREWTPSATLPEDDNA